MPAEINSSLSLKRDFQQLVGRDSSEKPVSEASACDSDVPLKNLSTGGKKEPASKRPRVSLQQASESETGQQASESETGEIFFNDGLCSNIAERLLPSEAVKLGLAFPKLRHNSVISKRQLQWNIANSKCFSDWEKQKNTIVSAQDKESPEFTKEELSDLLLQLGAQIPKIISEATAFNAWCTLINKYLSTNSLPENSIALFKDLMSNERNLKERNARSTLKDEPAVKQANKSPYGIHLNDVFITHKLADYSHKKAKFHPPRLERALAQNKNLIQAHATDRKGSLEKTLRMSGIQDSKATRFLKEKTFLYLSNNSNLSIPEQITYLGNDKKYKFLYENEYEKIERNTINGNHVKDEITKGSSTVEELIIRLGIKNSFRFRCKIVSDIFENIKFPVIDLTYKDIAKKLGVKTHVEKISNDKLSSIPSKNGLLKQFIKNLLDAEVPISEIAAAVPRPQDYDGSIVIKQIEELLLNSLSVIESIKTGEKSVSEIAKIFQIEEVKLQSLQNLKDFSDEGEYLFPRALGWKYD